LSSCFQWVRPAVLCSRALLCECGGDSHTGSANRLDVDHDGQVRWRQPNIVFRDGIDERKRLGLSLKASVCSVAEERRTSSSMMAMSVENLLGPQGPFPSTPIASELERRWLHYAFFSRDGKRSLIANHAWLGADDGADGFEAFILLTHHQEFGWNCSEWNARSEQIPWSSFAHSTPPRSDGESDFSVWAVKGHPGVDLNLRRTSTPCASQCATFAEGHFMRWQSEPGVLAEGTWNTHGTLETDVSSVGYHERVRGRWGWPEMGGWVFGFCNDLTGDPHGPPPWSIVFTLLQTAHDTQGQAASMMVWKDGRMLSHIPRKNLRVSVAGQLDRDFVELQPRLAPLLGTPPMAPIPAVLCIDGRQGDDLVSMRYFAAQAARLVIPSETSLRPFSVHEVLGHIEVELRVAGRSYKFDGPGVVEFAGGAMGGLA